MSCHIGIYRSSDDSPLTNDRASSSGTRPRVRRKRESGPATDNTGRETYTFAESPCLRWRETPFADLQQTKEKQINILSVLPRFHNNETIIISKTKHADGKRRVVKF